MAAVILGSIAVRGIPIAVPSEMAEVGASLLVLRAARAVAVSGRIDGDDAETAGGQSQPPMSA
jgi:hypothetical protein